MGEWDGHWEQHSDETKAVTLGSLMRLGGGQWQQKPPLRCRGPKDLWPQGDETAT